MSRKSIDRANTFAAIDESADMYVMRIAALESEVAALRAEVEGMREDAERYRWLRRRTTIGVGMVNIWSAGMGRYDSWQEEELDAAIDAARIQKNHAK